MKNSIFKNLKLKHLSLGAIVLGSGFLILSTNAQSTWQTAQSVEVKGGKLLNSAVLSDNKGTLFLEFIKDSLAYNQIDKRGFEGNIMAPIIIESPTKAPRPRMREFFSFELITDTNTEINFVDKYSTMNAKERLRSTILEENLERESGILMLTRIFNTDEINKPALWFLDLTETDTKKQWKRMGGIAENSAEPDIKIFKATLFKSGIYTLWDEDPLPENNPYWSDPLTIEPALPSPVPSVTPREEVPEESSFESDDFKSSANIPGEPKDPSILTQEEIDSQEIPAVTDNFSFNGETLTSSDNNFDREIPGIPEDSDTTNNTNETDDIATVQDFFQESLNEFDKESSVSFSASDAQFSEEFLNTVDQNTQFLDLQDRSSGLPLLPEAGINNPNQWNFPWAFVLFLLSIGASIYVCLNRKH